MKIVNNQINTNAGESKMIQRKNRTGANGEDLVDLALGSEWFHSLLTT